ncbi:NADH:ubiquinone oxidoreductase [Theobroma cacao]|nr:NADH:ubiquinone oxidoreductase [Theobroma cacao]
MNGLNLILKKPISSSSANFSFLNMSLVATFMLSMVTWAIVPFYYGMVLSDLNIRLLYLFYISSLGVYGINTTSQSRNESIYLPSFGRFPSTQSTKIPQISLTNKFDNPTIMQN